MKLSDGFEINIVPDALDNWELLEVLQEISDNQQQHLPKAARMLFGETEYNRLREHLRGENGIVKASDMIAVIGYIFQNVKNDTGDKEDAELKK